MRWSFPESSVIKILETASFEDEAKQGLHISERDTTSKGPSCGETKETRKMS